jgi:hypothetical protein
MIKRTLHKSGATRGVALLDTTETLARTAPHTLEEITQHMYAVHPDAPDFSLDQLSVGFAGVRIIVHVTCSPRLISLFSHPKRIRLNIYLLLTHPFFRQIIF